MSLRRHRRGIVRGVGVVEDVIADSINGGAGAFSGFRCSGCGRVVDKRIR